MKIPNILIEKLRKKVDEIGCVGYLKCEDVHANDSHWIEVNKLRAKAGEPWLTSWLCVLQVFFVYKGHCPLLLIVEEKPRAGEVEELRLIDKHGACIKVCQKVDEVLEIIETLMNARKEYFDNVEQLDKRYDEILDKCLS